jgi:tetratricopeptide (TPR) repeat protein
MRVTTLVIIIVVLGAVAFWAKQAGYLGEAKAVVTDSFASHYNAGNAKYQTQKYQEAIQDFERALQLSPQDENAPAAVVRMGDCYRELGQKDKAIECYQKVLDEYPNFKLRGQVEQTIEKTRALGTF